MKNHLSFVALLLCATVSTAQILPQTPWTWMKGDNIISLPGIYGIQCVSSSLNKPGARNYSATWRDAAGNLWLFGGDGKSSLNSGYLNDLWKFEPVSNKWVWMKGDKFAGTFGAYGTRGVPAAANKPGGSYSSMSWADAEGNLWLFGGYGLTNNNFGYLNTLWKYTISTNEWTWINGDKTPNQASVYGIKGVANSANKPGARYGGQSWKDEAGNLWLYGGYGYDGVTSGILNDTWKYDPSSNQWTWVNGDSTIDQQAIYGAKGVANTTNKPGARYSATSWNDENGLVWIFGGYGYDSNGPGYLNDLWKYDPSINQWTWVSGDNTVDQTAVYGAQGVVNNTNKPGARQLCSSWIDITGALWLFGGFGYDNNTSGYLNDLWKYNPGNNQWVWVKGDSTVDQPGVYGILGLANASNKSGARTGSVSWTDGVGTLWLFGGYGYDGTTSGMLNDLWKINSIEFILPVKLLDFSGVLQNDIVRLQWQTEQETGFSHFAVQRSFDGINFTTLGNLNAAGNSRNEYTYPDNDLGNRPAQKVFYRLKMIDKGGGFTYSKTIRFDWKQLGTLISVFPNPAQHSLNLSFEQARPGEIMIVITDIKGIVVKKQAGNIPAGRTSIPIDVSSLPAATYLISVFSGGSKTQEKFIKQ